MRRDVAALLRLQGDPKALLSAATRLYQQYIRGEAAPAGATPPEDAPLVVSLLPAATDAVCALDLAAALAAVTLECAPPPACAGVRRVVASDVDPLACRLAERNAERNGVGGIVVAHQLVWGETGDELDACVRAAAVPSRAADASVDGASDAPSAATSPALLIASDVLYDWTGKSADALERTLRALLGRGGAEQVLLCWRVRTRKEERFLHRLADLGDVSTVWRIGVHAPPLHASDDDVAWDDWTARNMGTFVMGRLRMRGATCSDVACRCGAGCRETRK
jgi:predicted nicotinamide N-methyase